MLLFVKSAKFRKKLNLQKNTQAKKRAKVSASSQTATPRHLRHASGKKSEGLGITTNHHATPFKARKRKKSEGLGITTNRHATPFKARKRKKERRSRHHHKPPRHLRHASGKRAKVSTSPQTATPRHLRHASGKKNEGLGHHHIFKARKRTTQAKSAPHRHESGHYRQEIGTISSPRRTGGNGAVVRDKR